jgi:energy-coupling factor transporter ATP-binding protein EcfA2
MDTTNRFALTFETMAELIPEIHAANANAALALPNLISVLHEYTPLPHEALFLGIANDGLPVLLNLRDPVPGPVLIAGDSGSGKTKLLQTVAQAIDETHDPDSVRYAVLTDNAGPWERFDISMNCEGVLSFKQPLTTNYLDSLVSWAHDNKQDRKFILLLVDGLESLSEDNDIHQIFRWLLLRGPARRIWPLVTLNAAHLFAVNQWLASFRTRLCGHLTEEHDIQVLTGSTNSAFRDLIAGSQFTMRENRNWLPFWLPNLD